MKKKILFINSSNFGSTGNIVKTLGNQLSNSYDFYYSYPKTRSNLKNLSTNTILIGDILFRNIGIFISKIFGLHNLLSIFSTLSYIKKIRKIKPDLVHIHNLHNGYINIVLLFKFLQSSKIKIIWTLHDTFSFTGKCVHFSSANCNKWITECNNCPLLRNYPDSLVDNSNFLFKIKKKLFTKFNKTDIVFITPSNWLSDQVKLSFLKEYKVSVIPNGIDTNIFKISKHYFESFKRLTQFKHVILGVANNWNDRKGLKIFSDLSKLIPNNQVVVLVGSIPNNFRIMNPNIIFIERTTSKNELASIYNNSKVFLNPSEEETMGMVTIEALACGLPVVVSNFTAVPEYVTKDIGVIVKNHNAVSYCNVIQELISSNLIKPEICSLKATQFNLANFSRLYSEAYLNLL